MKTIDSDVLEVLNRCVVRENNLYLPDQLERKLYVKTNDVLMLLGGKWDKKAKAHVFSENPDNVLYDAITSGQVLDNKKALQQFFTPPSVADALVEFADISNAFTILEPSAGQGAIIDAIFRTYIDKKVTAIEIDPVLCPILEDKVGEVHCRDFTDLNNIDFLQRPEDHPTSRTFDAVLMNPPFTSLQDVKHVLLAWAYVAEGGSLTAIMSPGWTFRDDRLCTRFREFLEEGDGYTSKEIEAGEFKSSGTAIRTIMIHKKKI